MTDPRCDRLDEYSCGWLSPEKAADFEAHLAKCPDCREEIDLQRQIDRLLAEEAARIERLPVGLPDRVERRVQRARRRRLLGWTAATAAAAGIIVAVSLFSARTSRMPRDDSRSVAQRSDVPANVPEPIAPAADGPQCMVRAARVTMVDPSSVIVVPLESHSPNVTLVCIYPTVKIARADDSPLPQ